VYGDWMCGIAGYFLRKGSKNGSRIHSIPLEPIGRSGPDDEDARLNAKNKACKFFKTARIVSAIDRDSIGQAQSNIHHDLLKSTISY